MTARLRECKIARLQDCESAKLRECKIVVSEIDSEMARYIETRLKKGNGHET